MKNIRLTEDELAQFIKKIVNEAKLENYSDYDDDNDDDDDDDDDFTNFDGDIAPPEDWERIKRKMRDERFDKLVAFGGDRERLKDLEAKIRSKIKDEKD